MQGPALWVRSKREQRSFKFRERGEESKEKRRRSL
jgi:hypothetical protein